MKVGARTKRVTKKTSTGFTLGLRAFRNISAVEGIKLSKRIVADLADVKRLSPAKRRAALLAKYGRKSRR